MAPRLRVSDSRHNVVLPADPFAFWTSPSFPLGSKRLMIRQSITKNNPRSQDVRLLLEEKAPKPAGSPFLLYLLARSGAMGRMINIGSSNYTSPSRPTAAARLPIIEYLCLVCHTSPPSRKPHGPTGTPSPLSTEFGAPYRGWSLRPPSKQS